MRVALFLALGTLLALPAITLAQWGWGPSYHASTAEEGIQRGAADVVRSQGMKNLMDSEAAKNLEQARSQNIDNRLKWTKTYFEMKRYNKEYRDANAKPRPTSEQLFRLAKDASPDRIGNDKLDPVTGKVAWPALLRQDEFKVERQKLDALYAQRAQASGSLTLDELREIEQTVKDLQIILKRNINEYPPQVYSSTNAFLKSLAYEARQAML